MLHRFITICLLFMAGIVYAQQPSISIRGNIQDTLQKMPLYQASVVLSRAKDSVMVAKTRADKAGNFAFVGLKPDTFYLMVTYPGYVDYAENIELKEDRSIELISMITRAVALETVIVRGSPIRMKGDTLSFMADSFRLREGENVEALLKRLPGLQVNSKGEITAQGKQVKRVLVDGDEFFGDDPTLATRNIRADMVKEVQVFDKKSDQATFTGVDDGQTEKTINLKLKEDAKNGYFGKVSLGGGLRSNYKNDVMANLFKGKRKISGYLKNSNVDKAGLEWNEESNYGGSMDRETEMGEDGSIMMFGRGDDFEYGGDSRNEGLPRAWTGGVNLGDKWKDNKNGANLSYRWRQLDARGGSTSTSQFILPDTQYFNNEQTDFQSRKIQHKFNGSFDFQIDSLTSMVVRSSGTVSSNQTEGQFVQEALDPAGNLVNDGNRINTNDTKNFALKNSILLRRKFEKKGRTLSLSLNQEYNRGEGDGILQNVNRFYKGGIPLGADTTDQKKENNAKSNSLSGRLAITEGIGKKGIVEWNYQYNNTRSENALLSFDKVNGAYTALNDSFSNSFLYKSSIHNTGLGYRYNHKKFGFGFGGNVAFSDWKLEDRLGTDNRNLNFTNFLGRANFNYKLAQQSNIQFNYNARTENPNMQQIQPLLNNNNPLFLQIGNPNLNIAFNQSIDLNFFDYKVLTGRNIYAGFYFSTISNAFSSSESVDELGRRISQTVNVNGNYNLNGNIYYRKEINKKGLGISSRMNFNTNRFKNIVNTIANVTNNSSYTGGFGFSNYNNEKFEFNVEFSATYNTSKSSIRPDVRTRFWTYNPEAFIGIDLPFKFRLNTNANYFFREKTSVFDRNNNAFIWNATLEKKVFKQKDVRVSFTVNDILNQNIGFNRQISSNFVNETSWQVIRRYWLVNIVWNFSKNGKPSEW